MTGSNKVGRGLVERREGRGDGDDHDVEEGRKEKAKDKEVEYIEELSKADQG